MSSKPLSLSIKIIIKDQSGNCLLLKRSPNSKANAGKWEFPGGKVDPGENFEEALIREVKEETGLVVSISRLLGATEVELAERKIIYLIMEGRLESGKVVTSEEHEDFRWIAPRALSGIDLVEQFKRFIEENSHIIL